MKKVLVIFFSLVYLGFTSGLVLEIHHCMGAVADVSLVPSGEEDNCGKCGMKKGANECCKDEFRFIKLQDTHKLVTADYSLAAPVNLVSVIHQLFYRPLESRLAYDNQNIHSPPGLDGISPHIINCVFRI